ncbi:MAG TPA: TonB family protein [Gemmatimonadaceae bacterium]|nr:TonB family protein [Gemmatimonadaceae bacterium]
MKYTAIALLLAVTAPLAAQAVRLRTVNGAGGAVSVGSVGDTVWLSIQPTNGDIFTIRADTATMAAFADGPTLVNDQAITFTRQSSDSSAYVVHGSQGTRRDSIQLSADSARVVFAALRGEMPGYTPPLHAYLKFQVQRNATLIPRTRVPEYPESQRSGGVEGDVQARFVVDSTGRVDAQSISILAKKNSAFENAVRVGLRQSRFQPAQVGGRNVPEVVDMGIQFRLPAILRIVMDPL